jgi:predicted nucleotidyltransferase
MRKSFHEIHACIEYFCQQQPAIMAAYLFGSAAQGTIHAASDLDIAVLLDPGAVPTFPLLTCITQLEESLRCQVDLIVLNTANDVLKYEVRKSGKLLFERSSRFRKQFEIQSRKAYEDFLYLHRRYAKTVLYA